jgi:uncharacterized 2Fe-2S/4Fe-4S cluster protein (DUF4445 family)
MKVRLRLYSVEPGGSVYRKTNDLECEPGRLAEILCRLSIPLAYPCGGTGRCGRCRVRLLKKSDPLYAAWTRRKAPRIDDVARIPTLPACQTFLDESALLFLPPCSEVSSVSSVRFAAQSAAGRRYALAVDLGSTNIDGVLIDLETGNVSPSCSVRNPQTAYGSDIVSRLGAIAGNRKLAEECRLKTHRALDGLVRRLVDTEEIPETARTSAVTSAVVAGNSVVTSLFLGVETDPMTVPPYEPASLDFAPCPASSCMFPIADGGTLTPVPLLSGLIGGDLTAGIFALQTNPEYGFSFGEEGPELLLDVGTNSEMLLFTEGKIYATQTAAGPVFEGESIGCGSRAAPNAVMRLRIEGGEPLSALSRDEATARIRPERFDPASAEPLCGLAGSAVIDLVAELLRTGDLSLSGKLNAPIPITPEISFSKKDVRQVQLAVGAIRAGLNVLLESAGVSWRDLKRLFLSGGLGCGIDFVAAGRVGLFSEELLPERGLACGNTSLRGVVAAVRRPELIETVARLRERVCRVQLGGNPRFREEFLGAMTFPAR